MDTNEILSLLKEVYLRSEDGVRETIKTFLEDKGFRIQKNGSSIDIWSLL